MLLRITIFLSLLVSAFSATEEQLNQEQQSQTATAITIIFDNSGSMSKENKLQQAKTAFSAWLEGQSEQTRFSLIHFEGGGKLAVPLGEGNRGQVIRKVSKLKARGKTPIVSSLKLAHKNIQSRRASFSPYERHIVVVFTDGYESLDKRGNKGVELTIKDLVRDNIEVIGIGFHGQGKYMRKVASQYFDANNTTELKQSLNQVEAEIDPNTEVELSEQDKKLMQEMDFSKPLSETSRLQRIPHESEPQKKRGIPLFFKVAIAVVVLISFLKK